MKNIAKLALLVLAPALLIACAQAEPKPQPRASTLGQIRSLVGKASCTASSQCQSLPLGATACGSPEGYLPWSSAQTDPKALQALAERYRAERIAVHAASGAVSDCRVAPDPGATCQLPAGICTPAPLPSRSN